MRLACSDYSFPALAPFDRLRLARMLGFDWISTSLFLDGADEIDDFLARGEQRAAVSAEQVEAAGVRVADVFLILQGGDFAKGAINSPDEDWRRRAWKVFQAALVQAKTLGASALTLLPGTPWPQRRDEGWHSCVDELARRVALAREQGVTLQIEPHLGSIASTPELVFDLIARVPGLGLVLDPSHFIVQSIAMDRILPLARHATQVHFRGARPGEIQVEWARNEIDFSVLVDALTAAQFAGVASVEYVPMKQWRCNEMDVLTAVVETRLALQHITSQIVPIGGKQ